MARPVETVDALSKLDLFVHTDVQLTGSGRLADYVIASKLFYEMPGTTFMLDYISQYANGWGPEDSYAQYIPAVVSPPAAAEVTAIWAFLFRLGQRLNLDLEVSVEGVGSVRLDMSREPTDEEMLELVHRVSRVPLEVVRNYPGGTLLPGSTVRVEQKADGWQGRLDLANTDMMNDLKGAVDVPADERDHAFRLICRRMPHVTNTVTPVLPPNRPLYNPAYLHPDDLTELGIADGADVVIHSRRASVRAIVHIDETVRRGVVSMSHGFGALPNDDDRVAQVGSSSARLIPNDDVFERYSGQPQMSNVPVRIETAVAPA